jgi:type IV secretory pathway VirB10-like protein
VLDANKLGAPKAGKATLHDVCNHHLWRPFSPVVFPFAPVQN